MLVRDASASPEALEVLVLRRSPAVVFGPGATVFPGGAVDPADHGAITYVRGLDDVAASREHSLAAGALALRVAAARECFEESGVLLARDARSGVAAEPRVEWRDALNAGTATFAELLRSEDLVLDARDLVLFSHWLTPLGAPRRYDTWFFVARAPDGHVATHDEVELVESRWVRPSAALDAQVRGEVDLILPTERSLAVLARFATTDELFAALAAVPRDISGRPAVVPELSGERVLLPGDDDRAAGTWTIPLPDRTFVAEAHLAAGDVRRA